jgi:hypothetical protein
MVSRTSSAWPTPVSRRDGGVDLADQFPPPQAAEMSCYSAA